MTDRHAYLIMTHKNTYVLEKLLMLIDDVRNDIFIHVDTKCKDFDYNLYQSKVRNSKMIFVKNRKNVSWGGYSIVEVELSLFKAATDYGEYLHYHLLSGQDMPIKTQDEIHKFCSRNSNISFIDINKPDLTSDFGKIIYRRVSIKRYISEEKKRESFVLKWFDRVILGIQYYLLKCDFVKKTGIQLRYGSQWCSLCDGHIRILLQNIDKIEYYFKKSSIPDELFVQSILAEMGLEKEIAGNKREIMWNHNDKLHPHVWVKEDYEKLKRSNAFFARKFDENFDKIVIDLVYEYIKP